LGEESRDMKKKILAGEVPDKPEKPEEKAEEPAEEDAEEKAED